MAWVKIKFNTGNIIEVPEEFYKTVYLNSEGVELVKESKPTPIVEKKIVVEEDVKEDEQIQEHKCDERSNSRKGKSKVTE